MRKPRVSTKAFAESYIHQEVMQDALRVELRTKLWTALTELLPEAKAQAKKGKPALLRLIVRHALRGGVLDVNPQGTTVPHVAIDRRPLGHQRPLVSKKTLDTTTPQA